MEPLLKNLDVQFVLLGTGEERYHDFFLEPGTAPPRPAAVFLTFNASLAQRIYAGSRHLSDAVALRAVRPGPDDRHALRQRAGGARCRWPGRHGAATTTPPPTKAPALSSSLTTPMALYTALVRGVETYRHPEVWRRLQERGMQQDFSWQASARKYVEFYERARVFRQT